MAFRGGVGWQNSLGVTSQPVTCDDILKISNMETKKYNQQIMNELIKNRGGKWQKNGPK